MDINPYKTPETKFDNNNGYHFIFNYNDHRIEAWGSSVSGKEHVSFDGEIVSEKRTHSRKSCHKFEKDNDQYEIRYTVKSILSGKLECALYVNSDLVKHYMAKPSTGFNILSFVAIVFLFAIYALIARLFDLPFWIFPLLLLFTVVISNMLSMKNIEIKEVQKKSG